jgi:hypothetical protein
VRVAVVIAVAVVGQVSCDPEEWGAAGHATKDHQRAFDRAKGGERVMGEQAMVSGGDAKPGQDCEQRCRDQDVCRSPILGRHDDRDRSSDSWVQVVSPTRVSRDRSVDVVHGLAPEFDRSPKRQRGAGRPGNAAPDREGG